MCAASDESISTLKCPDCSLSFSYLLSGAKKSFKLAFTPPPPLFFLEVSSLSLTVSSPFHFFFIPQCQGFHTENKSNNKDKDLSRRACFHSPE